MKSAHGAVWVTDKGHYVSFPLFSSRRAKIKMQKGAKGNHNMNANPNCSIDHKIHWLNFAHANIILLYAVIHTIYSGK